MVGELLSGGFAVKLHIRGLRAKLKLRVGARIIVASAV